MQGFMILAIIGTEKDTLIFYSTQIVDGRMDRKLNPYIAPCYKQGAIKIIPLTSSYMHLIWTSGYLLCSCSNFNLVPFNMLFFHWFPW